MSVRRILAKTIDTDLEYEAIGIDLAKNCVSAALLISGTRLIVKFVLAKSSHNHYFRLFKQTSLQFLDLL